MKTLQLPSANLHHTIRTEDPCWCDHQVRDLQNFFTDFQGQRWIIDIKKRNPSDRRTSCFLQTATWGDLEHKLFTTETGKGYYRIKDVMKSINIENFNKVIKTLYHQYEETSPKILDTPENIYWSNTRIHLALSPMWIEENQVIDSLKICFLRYQTTNIFHLDASRTLLLTIFKICHINERLWQRRFESGNFLSCNQNKKKKLSSVI
jgi:hypothetical protein